MRCLLILWLLLALPVQALLAQQAVHCPSDAAPAMAQPQHNAARHQGHTQAVAASTEHCRSQALSSASFQHCSFCVLCPALSALPALSGRLPSACKAPQLAAQVHAHSNRHVDVPEKPPKSSLLV
jgi:hypothetical protein